jgi:hypothetical protein
LDWENICNRGAMWERSSGKSLDAMPELGKRRTLQLVLGYYTWRRLLCGPRL